MRHLIIGIVGFCLFIMLTGCNESGSGEPQAKTISTPSFDQGSYGPKDWRTGVNPLFCTEVSGAWNCQDTAGVAPAACQGAQWLNGAFTITAGQHVSNTFNDSTYNFTGEQMQWFPSGVYFDVHFQNDEHTEMVLDFQPGCAILFAKDI